MNSKIHDGLFAGSKVPDFALPDLGLEPASEGSGVVGEPPLSFEPIKVVATREVYPLGASHVIHKKIHPVDDGGRHDGAAIAVGCADVRVVQPMASAFGISPAVLTASASAGGLALLGGACLSVRCPSWA